VPALRLAAVTALCSDVLQLLLTVMGTVEHGSRGQMDSPFQRYVRWPYGGWVLGDFSPSESVTVRDSVLRISLHSDMSRSHRELIPADLHAATPTPPMMPCHSRRRPGCGRTRSVPNGAPLNAPTVASLLNGAERSALSTVPAPNWVDPRTPPPDETIQVIKCSSKWPRLTGNISPFET
jgi:hypothetical protein